MAWKGNSKSYTRKIITELPLCSTVTLKKCSRIFNILLFGFFYVEGCSWNIQLILVIVGDSLLARISPGANWHHSPKTDSASLVHSGWKSVFFSIILSWFSKVICRAAFSGEPRTSVGLCPPVACSWLGVQLVPGSLPGPPGSAWLGSIAWVVSSSKVFLALCCKAAQFLQLFTL